MFFFCAVETFLQLLNMILHIYSKTNYVWNLKLILKENCEKSFKVSIFGLK